MYKIIRFFLFLFNPEFAHHLAMKSLKIANIFGLLNLISKKNQCRSRTIMGLQFDSPVGLAAGLDKNAEYIDCLSKLGFGFIEVGTVTPKPQKGNPKPRSFRLTKEKGIINRFGFNNDGIDKVIQNIQRSKFKGILGINIGKNFDTPINKAIDDYLICFRKSYLFASYITLNISSPNTKNLRKLQGSENLKNLLKKIKAEQNILNKKYNKYVPFLIKISPDNTKSQLTSICKLLIQYKIDGVIATNTTLSRNEVPLSTKRNESGGLSGLPLKLSSLNTQKFLKLKLDGKIPIIGVGGVMSAEDGKEKMDNGADLIQIYSGLIFKGHGLIHELCRAIK
ncbi:MAG: dihydroorotate dehydrogenase (quinone) [Nitrosomonadales bacterium]|nr:dihydroorotate dehydrogenase (quinone) [Nitrosomonadales bacterium]|tara:strand:- start:8770 stop:9780 length:1011 start_codon:yes stop_codon:yes gene_type:complete